MRLPRPRDFSAFASFEWFAAAFIHHSVTLNRMITVLAVNPACTGFIVLLKVMPSKLLVSLMMRGPAISIPPERCHSAYQEGVNFFRPRIKAVLVGNDQ